MLLGRISYCDGHTSTKYTVNGLVLFVLSVSRSLVKARPTMPCSAVQYSASAAAYSSRARAAHPAVCKVWGGLGTSQWRHACVEVARGS